MMSYPPDQAHTLIPSTDHNLPDLCWLRICGGGGRSHCDAVDHAGMAGVSSDEGAGADVPCLEGRVSRGSRH